MTNETETKSHPFQKTLGDGPYRLVGYFYINIQAGQMGRPYVNPADVHPRFVRGSGTCAHCGMAILNVYQIQIGNGDVFGVGSDCIAKVDMPVKELTALDKLLKKQAKERRAALKVRKGNAARETLAALIASQGDALRAKPHPSDYLANSQGLTLLDYASWTLEHTGDGGILFALKKIEFILTQ